MLVIYLCMLYICVIENCTAFLASEKVFGENTFLSAAVWETKNREGTLWPRKDPKTHTREKLNGKKYFPCLKNVILSWRQPHAEVHPSPCSVSCFTYFSVILILTDTHWAKDSPSYGLVSLKACSQTSGKQLVAELRTTGWAMVAFIVLQSKSVPSIITLQC